MVELDGHAWVLDFGLAALKTTTGGGVVAPLAFPIAVPAPESDASLTYGPLGTLPYMAPEQHRDAKQADARSDVWGLGVTLYELLTLRRAFLTGESVLSTEPIPPRQLNPGLDRDLEAVVLKSLRKDPAHRYPTAQALAHDLNHWVRREPVSARPAAAPRRLWLWARRNKGWAAALLGLVLTLVSGTVLAMIAERHERREVHIQKAERIRLSPHEQRWSRAAWLEISQAAAIQTGTSDDDPLQSIAIGSLRGLDAILAKPFHDFGASSLAFDAKGKRLLIGGVSRRDDGKIPLPARIWTEGAPAADEIPFDRSGPVGFRGDGTPIQLVDDEPANTLVLYDLSTTKPIRSFPIPGRLDLAKDEEAFMAMSAAGALVAAPVRDGAKRGLAVWDGASGRLLHLFPGRTHSAAFSNDGSLVAQGLGDGRVVVHAMATGAVVADLPHGALPVYAFSFAADYHRGKGENPGTYPDGRGWLLAAGGQGGYVTVWDLGSKQLRARCRGATWDLYAVAFSPDASLVASCGRNIAPIWDVASARDLLTIGTPSYAYALTFSPDGRRLAIAGNAEFGAPGRVEVFNLEDGRGIRSLRGLSGMIEKAIFSRDGRYVAALSLEWEVAIWDRETGVLRHVLSVPRGFFTDNTGLAFSPDGRRFAFAAGGAASLWDVDSGRKLQSWKLPPALMDEIAFRGAGEIVLARLETVDRVPPMSEFPPGKHPRVIPIRRLTPGKPEIETLKTLTDYPYHAFLWMAPDGSALVVNGRSVREWSSCGTVLVVTLTGKTLKEFEGGYLRVARFSSSGSLFGLATQDKNGQPGTEVWSYPKLERLRWIRHGVAMIAPDGNSWIETLESPYPYLLLGFVDGKSGRTLARIPRVGHSEASASFFVLDARQQFLWGEADGSVSFCDLPAIHDRLNEIGLGW